MGEKVELACRLVGKELAQRKAVVAGELLQHVEAITELPGRYELSFPAGERWAERVLEFVRLERQCCPFVRFEIAIEPNDGPATLRLCGGDDVKQFVRTELRAAIDRSLKIAPDQQSVEKRQEGGWRWS